MSAVRMSCEIAASIKLRSPTSRRSLSCIRLKIRAARRSSGDPVSGRGGAVRTSRPIRSAASEKRRTGLVTRRDTQAANSTTNSPPITSQDAIRSAQRSEVNSVAAVNTAQDPSRSPTAMTALRRLGSRSGSPPPGRLRHSDHRHGRASGTETASFRPASSGAR